MTTETLIDFAYFYLQIGLFVYTLSTFLFFYRVKATKTYYQPHNKRGQNHLNKKLHELEGKYGVDKTMRLYIAFGVLSRLGFFISWPKLIHYALFLKWKSN